MDNEIWAQWPKENANRHRAFLVYRNLGPERSLGKAYVILYPGRKTFENGSPRATPTLQRWSVQFHWVMRCAAWDSFCFREQERQWTDRQRELRARKWEASETLFEKGLERLGDIVPEELTPKDVARFLQLGSTLGDSTKEAPITIDQLKIFLDAFPPDLRERIIELLKERGRKNVP